MTAQVTVAAGQRIHVVSNKAFGTFSAGGASDLNLWICYQQVANPIVTVGAAVLGLQSAQNTRHLYEMSAVISGLPAGTYNVGLCGYSGSANWNYNEWSYTSALVFQ